MKVSFEFVITGKPEHSTHACSEKATGVNMLACYTSDPEKVSTK